MSGKNHVPVQSSSDGSSSRGNLSRQPPIVTYNVPHGVGYPPETVVHVFSQFRMSQMFPTHFSGMQLCYAKLECHRHLPSSSDPSPLVLRRRQVPGVDVGDRVCNTVMRIYLI